MFEIDIIKARVNGVYIPNSSSVAIDRQKACETGLFFEDFTYGEDVDFWLRMALHYSVVISLKGLSIWHWDRCEGNFLPQQKNFDLNRNARYLSKKLASSSEAAGKCFLSAAKARFFDPTIVALISQWNVENLQRFLARGQSWEALAFIFRVWRYYGHFPRLLFCTFYPQILISFWLKLPHGFRQKLKYFIPGVVKRRILGDE